MKTPILDQAPNIGLTCLRELIFWKYTSISACSAADKLTMNSSMLASWLKLPREQSVCCCRTMSHWWRSQWNSSDWQSSDWNRSYEPWQDKPETPKKKTSARPAHAETMSPQGTKATSLNLPEHFKPTATHYDERETFGMQFPKRIQPTQWAVNTASRAGT